MKCWNAWYGDFRPASRAACCSSDRQSTSAETPGERRQSERPTASRHHASSAVAEWKPEGMVTPCRGQHSSVTAACSPGPWTALHFRIQRSQASCSPSPPFAGRTRQGFRRHGRWMSKRARHTCRARRADSKKAPTRRPGLDAYAVTCSSSWTTTSTQLSPTCSACASATDSCPRYITGNHPVPTASRSASLAISAFLSFARRFT